jgi:hypothetical protein
LFRAVLCFALILAERNTELVEYLADALTIANEDACSVVT